MRREDLGDLLNLLAVADEGSFTRAAAKQGVSQSALSHAIRRLEERLGVGVLSRTTRSIALTQNGERLLETVRPTFHEIAGKLVAVAAARERPAGAFRITTSEHVARAILWPAVDRIVAEYPDITIELNVESGLTDLIAERFDAGVRLGEQLAKDMVAVRIGPPMRMAAVASPSYFAEREPPRTPRDLDRHACINLRMTSAGGLYVWEFSKQGRAMKVRVEGQLILNRTQMAVEAAVSGHGIAFVFEDLIAAHLAGGSLVRVLDDWCEPFDGYHLYYPSRRQQSTAFALIVEALRFRGAP